MDGILNPFAGPACPPGYHEYDFFAPGTAPGRAALQVNCSFCAKPSSEVAKASPRGTQLPAREEAMTDEEILALLPRIALVTAQTDASLQRLVTVLRGRG